MKDTALDNGAVTKTKYLGKGESGGRWGTEGRRVGSRGRQTDE